MVIAGFTLNLKCDMTFPYDDDYYECNDQTMSIEMGCWLERWLTRRSGLF